MSDTQLSLSNYGELLEVALKKAKNQHELTHVLRENRFVFISDEVIEELKLPLHINETHHRHDYMVIQYPKSQTYDCTLAFGIKIMGKLTEEVHLYLNGYFWKTLIIPTGRKELNFRKPKKRMLFPKELNYDDRALLRKEHLSLMAPRNVALGKKPSEFYKRYWPLVKILEK
jgi:hypothetical protein